MNYFIATLIILSIFIPLMALGVIFSNKPLKGSCGGLGKATGDKCSFCGNKDKCKEYKDQQLEETA